MYKGSPGSVHCQAVPTIRLEASHDRKRVVVVLLALPAVAQRGPCTEAFIKAQAATEHPNSVADDAYFFSGALDKPVVGRAAAFKAFAPVAAERKDENHEPPRPDRIAAAPSGEMAYDYGTAHVSYNERQSGKPIVFTAAYLRVWRAEGSVCRLAAEMFQPEK